MLVVSLKNQILILSELSFIQIRKFPWSLVQIFGISTSLKCNITKFALIHKISSKSWNNFIRKIQFPLNRRYYNIKFLFRPRMLWILEQFFKRTLRYLRIRLIMISRGALFWDLHCRFCIWIDSFSSNVIHLYSNYLSCIMRGRVVMLITIFWLRSSKI